MKFDKKTALTRIRNSVLTGLSESSLTRALVMDHLDWFTPGSRDVEGEVREFYRVLALGGTIYWRSASRKPWYNEVFVFPFLTHLGGL